MWHQHVDKDPCPSVNVIQKTRRTSGQGLHMTLPQSHRKKPLMAHELKYTYTQSVPVYVCEHFHPGHESFKGSFRGVGQVLACARKYWSLTCLGSGHSWSVASLPLEQNFSKLVHDAICVADGDWAVLAQPLPLESCAEGAHLIFLVLLLFCKLHKHLGKPERSETLHVYRK